MKHPALSFAVLAVSLLLLLTLPCSAVIHVKITGNDANDGLTWPTAKRSVTAAIAAAVPDDEIWVAKGTYIERITLKEGVALYGGFAGTELLLTERPAFPRSSPDSNETVLDGNQGGAVVTIPSGRTPATVIDGSTLRKGTGKLVGQYRYGGGIYCESSSPVIVNCRVISNTADEGGGIYCSGGAPTFTDNIIEANGPSTGGGIRCYSSSPTISGNTVRGNSWGGVYCDSCSDVKIEDNVVASNTGAGIYCYESSAAIKRNAITRNSEYGGVYLSSGTMGSVVSDNTISQNDGPYGGGISCSGSGPLSIANNRITGNSAYAGGGVSCWYSSAQIINNVIVGNSASGLDTSTPGGGAIACLNSSPTIANNTMVANSAPQGGGMVVWGDSSPTVANNIVAFNSSGVYKTGTANPVFTHNCLWNPDGYDYHWDMDDPTGTDGNVKSNPKLADLAYGNLHIQPDSPCKETGDGSVIQPDWVDMDGQPRIQGEVDIGADESDGTVWPEGPYVIVRVSPEGNDANDGSSWPLAKRTVQAGIDAASALGGEVWVKAGTYYEGIALGMHSYLYGGFAGTETDRSQRNWQSNATILDGEQAGSVVTAVRVGYKLAAVDGFTIRNAKGQYAAGVYCEYSSPAIANNLIAGNLAGGIGCQYDSSPTISGNIISGNAPESGGAEGGIWCSSNSSPIIVSNTIQENGGQPGIACSQGGFPLIYGNRILRNYNGGIHSSSSSPTIAWNAVSGNCWSGIYCEGGWPTILNNRIRQNWSSAGAGVYCWYSSALIANNVISGNSATGTESLGGGLYCVGESTSIIANNTITDNSASGGGGIYIGDESSPAITNNIVAFNSSGVCNSGSASPTFSHNCVYNPDGYDYCEGMGDPTGTYGNIKTDPKLADLAYGNLHIQPDSPCKEEGDASVVQWDWVDMDGEPRIQGVEVDIGADESDGTDWPNGPYAIVRVKPDGNDASDGSSWASAKRTVQAGIDAASDLGGEVWVKAGTYSERIALAMHAYVYGGFAGTESERSQRDWHANVTTLDGQELEGGSVVSALAMGDSCQSAIDGFTIWKGMSGIYCFGSSPTIANARIESDAWGIMGDDSSPIIQNSIVARGAGIFFQHGSPTITNVTIVGNQSEGVLLTECSATISNCIVAFNSSGIYANGGSPVFSHNCVYNSGNNYQGVSPGAGDISEDPLLADWEAGDYRLTGVSPCVDAGWNDAPHLPEKDIEGQPRVCGSTVDMGADEYCEPSVYMSITDIKQASNNTLVAVDNAIVSGAFWDFFYIEADNRESGIRVEKISHELAEGMRADVAGVVGTNSHGERYVKAAYALQDGAGSVGPLGLVCRGLGGSDWHYDAVYGAGQRGTKDGTGLNNIGLLIRTWGTVKQIGADDEGWQYMYLEDGSGPKDGTLTGAEENVGVRVICDPAGYSTGDKVEVTGISSCFWTPSGVARRILTRKPEDVRRLTGP